MVNVLEFFRNLPKKKNAKNVAMQCMNKRIVMVILVMNAIIQQDSHNKSKRPILLYL